MRNYKLGAIFLLSGHCLSDPINMESINSMHLDAEPTFSVDGKEVYVNCHNREGRSGSDICVSYFEPASASGSRSGFGEKVSDDDLRSQGTHNANAHLDAELNTAPEQCICI